MRCCHRFRHATAGGDVVFLDQEGIVKADAVVVAAAAGHGVFLRQAQAGKGLAGVQQAHLGAFHQVGQETRTGGDPRQHLQEVQRAALAAQQRAGRAFQVEQRLVGRGAITVGHLPVHSHTRVELAKHGVDPGSAGNHAVFAGDDGGLGQALGRDQLRGDIATADVLQQRAAHVGFDFSGQVGKA
ncbi:hypothetical protein D3C80_1427980 [compost metagenome]